MKRREKEVAVAEPFVTPAHLESMRLARGNAADQIVDHLRQQILSGAVPRGSKLPTEKQLADAYDVSGATVREAIRGLATVRMVDVRHGSGAYVTADADQMIAVSLRSMIQLERIGFPQVLGVLGALNAYAAELAATHATKADIAALEAALDEVDEGRSVGSISGGLSHFVAALASASGNPLLAALTRFLASLQFGLAFEMTPDSVVAWRRTTRKLTKERHDLIDAIRARDPERASAAASHYHVRALKVISALPGAETTRLTDPVLAGFLEALSDTKAG
jgi:GntR family transcriptional regulator, transcriptional repressor for pyruvate dehydrogenase complex